MIVFEGERESGRDDCGDSTIELKSVDVGGLVGAGLEIAVGSGAIVLGARGPCVTDGDTSDRCSSRWMAYGYRAIPGAAPTEAAQLIRSLNSHCHGGRFASNVDYQRIDPELDQDGRG